MIPVLLHQAATGHASEDARPRADKATDGGDFGELLNALSDVTGKPAPQPDRQGETSQRAIPADAEPAADAKPAAPKAESDAPTLMDRLNALLHRAGPDARPEPARAANPVAANDTGKPTAMPAMVPAEPSAETPAKMSANTSANTPAQPRAATPPDVSAKQGLALEPALPETKEVAPQRPTPHAENAEAGHHARAALSGNPAPKLPESEEALPTASRTPAETSPRERNGVLLDDVSEVVEMVSTAGAEMANAATARLPMREATPETLLGRLIDPPMRGAVEMQPAPEAAEPANPLPLRILLRETHFAPVTTVEAAKVALAGTPPAFEIPDSPSTGAAPALAPAMAPVLPETAAAAMPEPRLPRAEPTRPATASETPDPDTARDETVMPETAPRAVRREDARAALAVEAPALGAASAPATTPTMAAAPTSLAPVLGTPSEQVGAAIQRAGALPFGGGSAFETAARGPVRILEIQLHPVELGVVTVRLRNGRDGLEIRVQAARAETAQLLAQDRGALLASLSEHGHAPADLTITSISASAGLTGHDVRVAPTTPWRAPDEDAGERQSHSGARRDERQQQNPADRDTDDGAAE
ncbi:flagellar hook-length control protein FliK [Ancylobacter sp. WKF20]|uniref:flagellar hook-length control protein FliK n=1 Tax=Ancylobacter sp. WKF20 TaxID=3039801 RepID=UPI00243460DA|nr:flagellar hook-length control protein FliK [Ancylobacter sp. WKF20]WGD28602.1 flagellar hook-length control protein FliK [Ancylobacter sp. WKF20]